MSSIALVSSAQWTLSGGHVGDRQFTEKSSGVYELSLPGDTIYGKFLLKNGADVRYGTNNTYVCPAMPYSLLTEGDSLMMASSIASPVLTLDTNAGTLTATGDVQPMYVYGDLAGGYWKSNHDGARELKYQGNGIYKGEVQMSGTNFAILQALCPDSITENSLRGDYVAYYRFAPVVNKKITYDTPVAMEKCVRGSEKNFILSGYWTLIDVTANMANVTAEVSEIKAFNLNIETLYVIGSDLATASATSRWTDSGCDSGIPMTRSEADGAITFAVNDVAIRATASGTEDPRGEIQFANTLGSWEEIRSGYSLGWTNTTDTLTLNASNVTTANVRDAGKYTTPFSLPTGKYDISVTFNPASATVLRAVQTSTSAVETVATDEADYNSPAEWYDLDGRRIPEPAANGVYIRRQGSRTQKVWIFSDK